MVVAAPHTARAALVAIRETPQPAAAAAEVGAAAAAILLPKVTWAAAAAGHSKAGIHPSLAAAAAVLPVLEVLAQLLHLEAQAEVAEAVGAAQ